VEFIIVIVILIAAGYILFTTIKKQSKGDCGCGNGCSDCSSKGCDTKPYSKDNDKI